MLGQQNMQRDFAPVESQWQHPPGPAGALDYPGSATVHGNNPSMNTEFGDYNQVPSAPPLDQMDPIPGYNPNILNGGELAPPSCEQYQLSKPIPERRSTTNLTTLSEERARAALLEHVSHRCCYGKTAAEQLDIVGLDTNKAFEYILKTFTESRSTKWVVEPYQGQIIDGPHNGPPPHPWEIQINPAENFKDGTAFIEVPHTTTVKPCHICAGTGRGVCPVCSGTSRARCGECNGCGHIRVNRGQQEVAHTCSGCEGTGHTACTSCHGSGSAVCSTCAGRAQLRCYIKMTVTWKVHVDEEIFMETCLPVKYVKEARGTIAFEEEAPMVFPLTHFPDPNINRVSQSLVGSHRNKWPSEKILFQHHVVRVIPITEVHYVWKSKQGFYYVYGSDDHVYSPKYPQRCCWSCTIL